MAKIIKTILLTACLSLIMLTSPEYANGAAGLVHKTMKNPVRGIHGYSVKNSKFLVQVWGEPASDGEFIERQRAICEPCKKILTDRCHQNSLECACGRKKGREKEGCKKLMDRLPGECQITYDECKSTLKSRCHCVEHPLKWNWDLDSGRGAASAPL